MPETSAATLNLASEVAAALEARGTTPLLIGALAMAAHGYARNTEDVDFAVAVPLAELREIAKVLESAERRIDVSEPDAEDPLGGVVTVEAMDSLPVQIVNFENPPSGGFPRLVKDAAQRSTPSAALPGRLVSLEDLILFKLYAGGPKSELDILELLVRCRVDVDELSRRALSYGLERELDSIRQRVGLST